jgi:hypothetical protein
MLLFLKRPALLGLLLMCCAAAVCAGQKSSAAKGINTLAAPIPAPLLNGRKAFISYELGDVTAFPDRYSGGPERAYNEFFAQMKTWGRYELVLDPKDADLIFAVRFVDSPGLLVPQIRLSISDAQTHVTLWGFVEQVDPAFFKKHRDASFSESVQLLISDMKALLDSSAAGAPPPGETRPSEEVH